MSRTQFLENLFTIRSFLKDYGSLFFDQSQLASYAENTEKLIGGFETPGEVLYVGILGGTGVGKSSLINALAGSPISDSSDRRPYTDRAVVYRHAETPRGLDQLHVLFRPNDALHNISDIKEMILLDLPDFDAYDQRNRETVLGVVPYLDAVIWVLSPEKYADAAFYEFIDHLQVNRENFSFVLNKSDQLIFPEDAGGLSKLHQVIGDVLARLKQWGHISDPRLFAISATQEIEHEPSYSDFLQSEFQRLRNFLMVRRDAKEIAGIKTKNLIDKSQDLFASIFHTVDLHKRIPVIRSLKATLTSVTPSCDIPEYETAGLKSALADAVEADLIVNDMSINPVRSGMRIMQRFRRTAESRNRGTIGSVLESAASLIAERCGLLHNELLTKVDTEITYHFEHTPSAKSELSPESIVQEGLKKASLKLESSLKAPPSVSKLVRLRRAGQFVLLALPFLLLIIRLSGFRFGATQSTGLMDLPGLLINMGVTLFGPEGLVGIVALLIWETILVFFLAGRRLKKIRKSAEFIADSVLDQLVRSIRSGVEDHYERKRSQLNRIEAGMDLLGRVRPT